MSRYAMHPFSRVKSLELKFLHRNRPKQTTPVITKQYIRIWNRLLITLTQALKNSVSSKHIGRHQHGQRGNNTWRVHICSKLRVTADAILWFVYELVPTSTFALTGVTKLCVNWTRKLILLWHSCPLGQVCSRCDFGPDATTTVRRQWKTWARLRLH